MDGHHGIVVPEQGADFVGQIAQGVPVFRKDNEFFSLPIGGKHFTVVLQQLGKLVPLAVYAAYPHSIGHLLQPFQRGNFRLHLPDGAGSGCPIGDIFLGLFQLICAEIVLIIVIRQGELRAIVCFPQLFLCQNVLQPLPPAVQGLINGFRRGGKPPLQDGQRKANGCLAVVVQVLCPVELLLHIAGDLGIKLPLGRGEVVVDGISTTFREQRCAIEFEQLLFHEPPHYVRNVDALVGRTGRTFKTVWVHQREKQLEILVFAIVGRGGQKQEVAGNLGKQSSQIESLGVFDLTAPDGGRHFVRFIADDQIPVGDAELFLQGFAA